MQRLRGQCLQLSVARVAHAQAAQLRLELLSAQLQHGRAQLDLCLPRRHVRHRLRARMRACIHASVWARVAWRARAVSVGGALRLVQPPVLHACANGPPLGLRAAPTLLSLFCSSATSSSRCVLTWLTACARALFSAISCMSRCSRWWLAGPL